MRCSALCGRIMFSNADGGVNNRTISVGGLLRHHNTQHSGHMGHMGIIFQEPS